MKASLSNTELNSYHNRAIEIAEDIIYKAEEYKELEICTCHLHHSFFDLSTAIWIFENCDEDALIEHQMMIVDEIEKDFLDLNSDFDHQHIH